MNNLLERFLKYVKIDTESDANSTSCPSTQKQFDLANVLVDELNKMGLSDISLDENCYIMATLPANTKKTISTIGFIAHMDTSPDMSGKDVNPQIHKNYDGKDIILNKEQNIVLSPSDFPELTQYKGKTIITSDGTTLLGADDKAGIATILEAIEYLIQHPEIEHGEIRVGFTPDEEIGRGADFFDVKKFNADFAYTIDGGEIGELEFENFNAALAKLSFKGRNVHPGTAKNQMKNSMHLAIELNSLLPVAQRPEHTDKYEGFFHLISMSGEVEESSLMYIIRDHDREKFESKKVLIKDIVDFLNKKYGENTIILELNDQYYNMREKIEPVMHIVDLAEKAIKAVGVKPNIKAIRGGTDGARLSFMGLPTPNIFAGGHNFHGRYEYIPFESMEKTVEVIVKIIELHAK
ncbi:MAG: peptidase T [Bacteroidales bacterium]|nr:peptidase T [Bacteroidales bacterium]